MFDPISTYRIQLHQSFNFSQLSRALPYLHRLGIKTLYASPIFEALPGSRHGYDTINPLRINPEIGTETEFRELREQMKALDMHWIQDIVPNHMAMDYRNDWFCDLMEWGPASAYAAFFDCSLSDPHFFGEQLMIPVLGTAVIDAIKAQQLQLAYDGRRLVLQYQEQRFPLQAASYTAILFNEQAPAALRALTTEQEAWTHTLDMLADACTQPEVADYLQEQISRFNQDPELLLALTGIQHYTLCHWQQTNNSISYRRFFTVNGLIGIRQENPEVFRQYHSYISTLVAEGLFDGLRVDHIDGLYDPAAYLQQLRWLAGPACYITVEKILSQEEQLSQDWPVEGTTGYDFLAEAVQVSTNREAEPLLSGLYQEFTGHAPDIPLQRSRKKMHILHDYMNGELDNLLRQFRTLIPQGVHIPSDTILRSGLARFLVAFPAYRFYADRFPLSSSEAGQIKDILEKIRQEHPEDATAIALLDIVLLHIPGYDNRNSNEHILHFYRRCMQITGPLMAKGLEDTLFYTQNRFIVHNEVGSNPEAFGISHLNFHRQMLLRRKLAPLTINTTATHDTKRGEDARSRLAVLADIPEVWAAQVRDWHAANKEFKTRGYPDTRDEYFIYQSLVAAYPLADADQGDFESRVNTFLIKALREGKRHSSWDQPDEAYEQAATGFVTQLLQPNSPFRLSLADFCNRINDAGLVNSLAQLILKCTCPGVPDTYQGTETWDYSFVDPDNRRDIDFEQRASQLDHISSLSAADLVPQLWSERRNGSIKLWLLHRLLRFRKQAGSFFREARYIPIQAEGTYARHVLAFARRQHNTWLLIIIPTGIAAICQEQACDVLSIDWKDTRIQLPEEISGKWTALTGTGTGTLSGQQLLLATAFWDWPFAILHCPQTDNKRRAGILLPVTALPSAYGIGGLGREAQHFADFLFESGQHYWQILPLNPINAGSAYSPYSSVSAMAANPLMIDPEGLAAAGLVDGAELAQYRLPAGKEIRYDIVEKNKSQLFQKAFARFRQGGFNLLEQQFERFREQEAGWLPAYAMYVVLSRQHGHKAWHQWPAAYRNREPEAMAAFEQQFREELLQEQWLQFLFDLQWTKLKKYCNRLGISIFGDMPFYVSYGSADVWMNPEMFCLDEAGQMTGIAGVPPDYFSEDGQLWGMPTFNWAIHKESGFSWWIRRTARNLYLFDLLRIDHFRALADYWEVPAGAVNARNGRWLPGPGMAFFEALKAHFGHLPIVAEDLGDDMDATYALRDAAGLPGMKVLQFAFGANIPLAPDIPHLYPEKCIVYTGTHDNNTVRGWYRYELNEADKERIRKYSGCSIQEKNIHLILIRMAYASVAQLAIIPVQDLLGLGQSARINTPGTAAGNWTWRCQEQQLSPAVKQLLRSMGRLFNRR